ncbi:MAG: efflux RND transporter periplasmic adaptor subunit [Betaproteobacteria bacterium]|nr:efflux RND transporter periplasmic adaptor subunit [Betaproteobacteria bacterium]
MPPRLLPPHAARRLTADALCARLAAATLCGLLLTACGDRPEEKKAGPPPTLVTVTQAAVTTLEVTEDTLGSLEAVIDPTVRAEVAGRVLKVMVRPGDKVRRGQALVSLDDTDLAIQTRGEAAETARLEALLAQQEKLLERQKSLVARGFISRNAVDDATAQRDALRAQLAVARARADAGRSSLSRTAVSAPVEGEVEVQIVAPGDYVKVGDPLIRLVSNRRLRAHLPYPESAAARLKPGLRVRIASPQNPGRAVEGVIDDIRPTVTESSRALDVIARFDNEARLLAGGTVSASVVVARREGAIVVPEQSVVLRPAGRVVYEIAEGRARQRVVETGSRRDGRVEIVSGLAGGETLALDGAGFLTDGAAVNVKQPGTGAPKSAPNPAGDEGKKRP